MDVYLDFIKKTFHKQYIYKTNSLLFIFTTVINLLIQISVWTALFKTRGMVNGITLNDMITYVIISLLVSTITRSSAGMTLGNKIREGTIAIDFIRPISVRLYLLAEDLGNNLFYFVVSVLPPCIVAGFVFDLIFPEESIFLILFFISIFNGIVINYLVNFILGSLCFWFKDPGYIGWSVGAFVKLFSGRFVPLWFYPGFLFTISKILPFRLIFFEPISIYLGKTTVAGSMEIIFSQIIWIVVLIGVESLLWNRGKRIVTIFGG